MKKFLLATVAVVALGAGTAIAADMSPVTKAPVQVRPACAQFGGFYVGANGGWAYHDSNWVDRDAWVDNFSSDFQLGTAGTTNDGGTAGGQIGYNWQRGCTVFGFEVDANWTDLNSTKSYSPNPILNSTDLSIHSKVDWFGTIRTRAGVVVDDLLLYATGGFAYANIKSNWTMNDTAGGNPIENFASKKDRWGWVGGVGAEWAWTGNWSIKTEALYIRFTEKSTSGNSLAGAQIVTFDHQDSMWVTRVGLNYKFGAPVRAAY